MKYNDILNIDVHFQNSINIGLDLNDDSKINSYIPTTTGINYLNHFISNVIDNDDEKSSMLIAPYGKGKSHAVLVLLSLLSSTNYENYKKLLTKIEEVDVELANKIKVIQSKRFLPVIISNTRGTLNQSLLLSMQKALRNAGIHEVLLQTDFHQAYSRVQEWKHKYPDTYNNFLIELKNRKIPYEKFVKSITSYNESALRMFKEIHKKILSGAEFVSQNTLEVVDYYQEITEKLISDYNFDGVYIVFDEFSKFLESRDEKTISNDMKIIQDLAELCNNSKQGNSYIQLILHKPISDYLSIDKKIRNAFKGIEGRVTSYYFVTTLKSSFDLIANVLQKNEKYYDYKKQQLPIHYSIANLLCKLPIFYSEFDESYIYDNLIDGCYPLHPLAAYLLVKTNEKVAQNERTLFTFLAKNTTNSLCSIINNSDDTKLLLPSVVFDYFEQLFLEEKDNVNVHKIATKAISALNSVNTQLEKELIKTLALLLIVNEKESLPTNVSVLSSAIMLEKEECNNLVYSLIERGILVQRHGGQIQFKINMDLNIDSSINNLVSTKFTRINIEKELKQIIKEEYYYPRTYNIINSITRYYRIEYLLVKDFLTIDNVNQYFDEKYADGLIINLIRNEDDFSEAISSKVVTINNDRLIVVLPKNYNDYSTYIKKMLAVQSLLNDQLFIENNPLIRTELELMYDDTKNYLNDLLNKDFSFSIGNNVLYCTYNNGELNDKKRVLSKNRILGDILTNTFNMYPNCFNLELINKNDVKASYKKAREAVVDKILNNKISADDLGTSPEDTVINCILVETGILNGTENIRLQTVLSIIKDFFAGENNNFSELYKQLMQPPYGIRKGIIPILIAFVINKMKQCVLLSFKGQEVETTAYYLELLNDEPSNFTYVIDEINASKVKYVETLGNIFDCEIGSDMPKNYTSLATSIRHWYISLPKFTKQMIGNCKPINSKKYKMLRKQLTQTNINSSEFILFSIPKIIGTNELEKTVSEFKCMKDTLDIFVLDYLNELKFEINEMLGFERNTTLSQSVNYWIDNNQTSLNSRILNESIKNFISNSKNNIDSEINFINKIAYCFTSFFVEDWSNITHDQFISEFMKLKEFETSYESLNDSNDKITLHIDGKVFEKNIIDELDDSVEIVENFIESTMDDFGDSLTNEQKIALLVKIMRKYF